MNRQDPTLGVVSAAAARSRRLALAVLLSGNVMAVLDATVVTVGLPSMQAGLGASDATLAWVFSGYALTYGLLLIPSGRLGDSIGHKPVFAAGLLLFTLSSLACGLAQEGPAQLVAARLVQGVGAGVFGPAVGAMIRIMFAGQARGKAFGLLGAVIGISSSVAPLVGGLLIQLGGETNGWRLVFLINLPIGLVAIPAAIRLLPSAGEARRPHRFDVTGIVLLAASLVLLLMPLVEGDRLGWPAWIIACLVAAPLAFVALALWEIRLERRGAEPLVLPHLFRIPAFTAGVLIGLSFFAAFIGFLFQLSYAWQVGFGHGALATGLLILPFSFFGLVGSALSTRVTARLGRGVLLVGGGLALAGFALVAAMIFALGTDVTAWHIALPLAIAGLGQGLFIAPNQNFVLSSVRAEVAGAASGIITTAQRLGTGFGIALGSAIMFGMSGGPGFSHSESVLRGAAWAGLLDLALLALTLVLILALPGAPVDRDRD